MASFSFWTSDVGKDYAQFRGSFTGGDGNYGNYRIARLKFDGTTYDIYSNEKGGASSSFSFKLTGLAQGTRYNWSVTLCYLNGSNVVTTTYTDSGSFTTEREIVAEFDCNVTDVSYSSATFHASFTGGDAGYARYRYVRLTINGETTEHRSYEYGGANSTFDFTVTGLPSDSTLRWTAVLCYIVNNQIMETNYSDSGYVTTPKAPGYEIYIGNGSRWKRYTAYIGNGRNWEPYIAKIGDGSNWQPN